MSVQTVQGTALHQKCSNAALTKAHRLSRAIFANRIYSSKIYILAPRCFNSEHRIQASSVSLVCRGTAQIRVTEDPKPEGKKKTYSESAYRFGV